MTVWKDTIKDQYGNVIERGTPLNAANLNKIETGLAGVTSQLADTATKNQVEALTSGTPKLIVQSVSNLPSTAGVEKLALVLDSDHKYFWNGSTWVDGGVYQATVSDDFPATNVLVNGDFGRGLINWAVNDAAITAVSKECIVEVTKASPRAGIIQTNVTIPTGNKYYTALEIYPKYPRITKIGFEGSTATISDLIPNNWNRLSLIDIKPASNSLLIYHDCTAEYVVGDTFKIKNAITIDLTKTFGLGNEPSVEEMDGILSNHLNSWFNGTVSPLIGNKELYGRMNSTKSIVSVADFGAIGDENRSKDETAKIQKAIDSLKGKGGIVQVPVGTYIISKTLRIPSNVSLVGAGKNVTTIRSNKTAEYNTITPLEWAGTPDLLRYRSMIAAYSSGDNGDDTKTTNISIKNMTIDWNSAPAGNNSIAPIMMDRVKNSTLKNVEVINTIPASGLRAHGCAVLFSFTEDFQAYNLTLHAVPYETVSVRYLSRNIQLYDCLFDIDNPGFGLPVGQEHAIQSARPTAAVSELTRRYGDVTCGSLHVYNCSFYMGSGIRQVWCVHSGKEFFMKDCYVYVKPSATMLEFLFKPFDLCNDVVMTGNYIDATKYPRKDRFPVILGFEESVGYNNAIQFNDNVIKIKIPDNAPMTDIEHPVIGGAGKLDSYHQDIQINNNQIHIENYPNRPFVVIGVKGRRWLVQGNIINFKSSFDTITTEGPIGIEIEPNTSYINITNNILEGNAYHGKSMNIHDSANSRGLMITGNMTTRTRGIAIPSSDSLINVRDKIIKDNMSM